MVTEIPKYHVLTPKTDLVDYPSPIWTVNDISIATKKVVERIATFIFGDNITKY